MEMETKTYKIVIGADTQTLTGTDAELWAHVTAKMASAPSGTIPQITAVTPAPDATPAPAQAVTVAPVTVAQVATLARPTLTQTATPASRSDAVAQGVSAEGAARSTADLLAAQAAGFAPARPLYDRGTPVIGLGVSNARKSATEHDAKARVPEAVDQFVAAIKSEGRHDLIVPVPDLAMRADGRLTGNDGKAWGVEAQALTQLASRIGIDQPAYLGGIWPGLRAMNWNQHIATVTGDSRSTCPVNHPAATRLRGRADSSVRLRMRGDGDNGSAVWAAVSEKYASFDVDQIAHALQRGMQSQPDARCEITYDGTGAQFDVLFHTDVAPEKFVAGEFFKAGIRVKTSDAGGGSLSIGLLLWQNLCLNLIVIDVASYQIDRIRHMGNAAELARRFSRAVATGQDRLSHFLAAWNYATSEVLVTADHGSCKPVGLQLIDEPAALTYSETELLAGIFAGLGKTDKVSIGRDDMPGLLASHAKDASGAVQAGPITRASIVNAITRHAHEHVGRIDAAKQSELEREAGALLVGSRGGKPAALPFLPPARR